jgi:ribulose 1,5-bisphosphate carboxylase large subunit-like protein
MYLLVLIPLKLDHAIGIVRNRLWGIDKIILGTAVGSVAFLAGMWVDKKIRKVKGKQLFAYQKVVFPVTALVISSLIFYFVTKR